MNEKHEAYLLAGVGAVKGVWEYYIRPIPNDMMDWITGKLIQFDTPEQEAIDAYIAEVSSEAGATP